MSGVHRCKLLLLLLNRLRFPYKVIFCCLKYYYDIKHHKVKDEYKEIISKCYSLYGRTYKNQTVAKNLIANYGNEFEQIKVIIKSNFIKGKLYTTEEIKTTLVNTTIEPEEINSFFSKINSANISEKQKGYFLNGSRALISEENTIKILAEKLTQQLIIFS